MDLVRLKGKIVGDAGRISLQTSAGTYYPVPFPANTRISSNMMNALTHNEYYSYMGRFITLVGEIDGSMIYSAKVVRTKPDTPSAPVTYNEVYWNDRVPKANILYRSRKLPGYEKHFKVDVRQMITINDSVIEDDLKRHSLMVETPSACDEHIYLIYRHSRIKKINPYVYEYDRKAFGIEFFMYPYELRQLQKGDCDDWGIELASYLITAGVPEWRVRCVAGRTYQGIGHLTVYVLADNLKDWFHLNSTTRWRDVERKRIRELSDFPQPGDETDRIGIKDVWFSFNNKYAWHAFETETSEEDSQKEEWMHSIEITPIFD